MRVVERDVTRKVFICIHCEGIYADAPVSECDCAVGPSDFVEGVLTYKTIEVTEWNGALEQEIKQWADSRWPTRTLASRLRKLGGEVGELAEAVCLLPPYNVGVGTMGRDVALEAADCAIILSDICSLLGYSLPAVMREKFAEVQARPVVGERR